MNTLPLIIGSATIAAACGMYLLATSYRDWRNAIDVDAPIGYMPTVSFTESLHHTFAQADEGDGVDNLAAQPPYRVEHRRTHSTEFDTNKGYVRARSETRVRDGHREHVFLIGDVDFALTEAPQLAAAILNVYHAQLDAEGLIVKASHDD